MNRLVGIYLVVFTLVLSSSPSLMAHGNSTHVLGTVTETSQDYVVVKTPKGESLKIIFDGDTNFQENGINKKDARPQVGARLVADVAQDGSTLIAKEIRFSTKPSK